MCDTIPVTHSQAPIALTRKLIDMLHVEAMVLSDEARSYFDGFGIGERAALDPAQRVIFSCEALKVTTRLMHVVAWLIGQRALLSGELSGGRQAASLGRAETSSPVALDALPEEASRIVSATLSLYTRVQKIEANLIPADTFRPSPAHVLQEAISRAY